MASVFDGVPITENDVSRPIRVGNKPEEKLLITSNCPKCGAPI